MTRIYDFCGCPIRTTAMRLAGDAARSNAELLFTVVIDPGWIVIDFSLCEVFMWQRHCPLCKRELHKNHAWDKLRCLCGWIWR